MYSRFLRMRWAVAGMGLLAALAACKSGGGY